MMVSFAKDAFDFWRCREVLHEQVDALNVRTFGYYEVKQTLYEIKEIKAG